MGMNYRIDTTGYVFGKSEHVQTPIDWSLVPWRMPAIDTSRPRHELVHSNIAKKDLLPTASIIEHVVRHLEDRTCRFVGRDLPDYEPGKTGMDHRRTLVWNGGGYIPKPPALKVECADILGMEMYVRIGGANIFLNNGTKEVCSISWTFPMPHDVPKNATAVARTLCEAFHTTILSSRSDSWMGSLGKAGHLAGQALSTVMMSGTDGIHLSAPRQGCPLTDRVMATDRMTEESHDIPVAIHPAVLQAMIGILDKPLYSTGFLMKETQVIILNESPVFPVDMGGPLDPIETLRLFELTGGAPLAMDANHDPGRPEGDPSTWLMPKVEYDLFNEKDVDRSL